MLAECFRRTESPAIDGMRHRDQGDRHNRQEPCHRQAQVTCISQSVSSATLIADELIVDQFGWCSDLDRAGALFHRMIKRCSHGIIHASMVGARTLLDTQETAAVPDNRRLNAIFRLATGVTVENVSMPEDLRRVPDDGCALLAMGRDDLGCHEFIDYRSMLKHPLPPCKFIPVEKRIRLPTLVSKAFVDAIAPWPLKMTPDRFNCSNTLAKRDRRPA